MIAVVEFINAKLVGISTQLDRYYRAESDGLSAEDAAGLRGEQRAYRQVLAIASPTETKEETENADSGRDVVPDLQAGEG